MESLEEKIRKDGKIFPGDILNVSSFLNHQLDMDMLDKIGAELYNLFHEDNITKILTIEASGIAIAVAAGMHFKVPVVFAKKSQTKNITSDCYSSSVFSYTHKNTYEARIERQYLTDKDTVLIVDDFLANGLALAGLIDICNQAGAKVAGCGIAIEKAFQDGGKNLRNKGIRVESLARVKSLDPEKGVEFVQE